MNHPKDQEAILYEFALELRHDDDVLVKYLKSYPELSEELIDIAFEHRLSSAEAECDYEPIQDSKSDTAWNEFINSGSRKSTSSRSVNFLTIFRESNFDQLASDARLNRSLFFAFRDRTVEPSTVPQSILLRVSDAVGATVQNLRDHLAKRPSVISAAQIRPDNKSETVRRKSFRELVESTEMSDDERGELLKECNSVELD